MFLKKLNKKLNFSDKNYMQVLMQIIEFCIYFNNFNFWSVVMTFLIFYFIKIYKHYLSLNIHCFTFIEFYKR